MRRAAKFALLTAALAAAAVSSVAPGAEGLWNERAGLGLKPSRAASAAELWAFGREPAYVAPVGQPGDYALYGGIRDLPRLGLRATESYSGVSYSGSGIWSSSFETGVAQEPWLGPRRYSLSGRVQTALSDGRSLSVGLHYRMYEPGGAAPLAVTGDPGWSAGLHAYGFARVPGAGFGPSYQLQLSYQHSTASSFGLTWGRDLETFTPGFDALGNGTRQLTFTGQHWLSPSWALSYDVLSNDPGNPFRLQGLRLGVRYRF